MTLTKSRYYIEEMGLWETGDKCRRCGSPMLKKINDEYDFCWECVVNKESARRGRLALEKLRLAVAGVTDSRDNHLDEGAAL